MDAGHQLAMAIRAAYLSMHRQADASLSPFGLTANQFVLLSLLDQQDQVTQRELSQRACSDPNTIRPMLLSLEKRGYLRRRPHPKDGRAWCLSLTAGGRRIFRQASTGSEAFRKRLVSNLSSNEFEHILEELDRIVQSMSSDSQSNESAVA